jgi:hypothetical protein
MSTMNLSILKYAVGMVTNRLSKEVEIKQILEPLSTLIQLAIISYKEEGTKIAIYDHRIYIQPPSILQAPMRMVYGNNREELHHLLNPIMLATMLYPPEKSNELKSIYNLAIQGIKRLKNSYRRKNGSFSHSSTVCHTLDLYISILDRKVLEKSIHIDSYENTDENSDAMSLESQQKIFQDLWEESDISLVYNLFKSANKSKERDETVINSYLTSVENLVKAKENIIEEKIKKSIVI